MKQTKNQQTIFFLLEIYLGSITNGFEKLFNGIVLLPYTDILTHVAGSSERNVKLPLNILSQRPAKQQHTKFFHIQSRNSSFKCHNHKQV